MAYAAKDYSSLVGMQGFSDASLQNHFTLYQGYVANINRVLDTLVGLLKDRKMAATEYAELKRRMGWEFNGMRLHEFYFDNLGGKGGGPSGKLAQGMAADFGSTEGWEADFRACGAMRGIGWVVLYQDAVTGRLINMWINEHDAGHPAGGQPLLVMDVFEHAFVTDYGLKRADYIQAFFGNINWGVVEDRLR
ncbi:MAG: Fe-Mn family superoxide dismutase [Dehalococcoidia bacterium]|jgi:Fe-Mn family superoxide dismutase|nr:Fe-Mn family superoxide dismutase [Dehalococcoidia bacterium]